MQAYRFSQGQQIQSFSGNIVAILLAQNTEKNTTVPDFSILGRSTSGNSSQIIARITVTQARSIFCALNETAAVPGSSFASSTGELLCSNIITEKLVFAGDVLSFITPDAAGAYVCVSYFQSL